ncbi:MAG: hypothetical protein WD944_01415 [Steroidobacteraceae bacterium]
MAKSRSNSKNTDPAVEVLKDILIAQLGIAGVPQKNIRKIVGCDIHRVSAIVRHIKLPKGGAGRAN